MLTQFSSLSEEGKGVVMKKVYCINNARTYAFALEDPTLTLPFVRGGNLLI